MDNLINKRKTIGVLIDNIDGFYNNDLWRGIRAAAKKKDMNTLVFSGKSLNAIKMEEAEQNVIYKLVNTNKLDGIIVVAGTLSNFIGLNEFGKFVENYKTIPIVSISAAVNGIPSIVFDNKASMCLIVEHLIKHHNYSRLAFIGGPKSNSEAVLRYNAYEEVLRKYNIPIDDNLVAYGDFEENSGMLGIDKIIKDSRNLPDVIICANDGMAIGAFQRLGELGIVIGRDIALTGFDDIEVTKGFSSSFTTVKQPLFEMGMTSIELINDMFNGKKPAAYTNINGQLMLRESCGCNNIIMKFDAKPERVIPKNNSNEMNIDIIELELKKNIFNIGTFIVNELDVSPSDKLLYKDIIESLMIKLIDDIKKENLNGSFIEGINYILNNTPLIRKYDFIWYEVLSFLRNRVITIIDNHEVLSFIEDLFYRASILTGNIFTRKEVFNQYKFKKTYIDTRKIIRELHSALFIDQLIVVMKDTISKLGITQFYLCLFDKPVKNISLVNFIYPLKAEIVLGIDNDFIIANEYFETKDMLPKDFIHRKNRSELLFLPLSSGDDHFGYIACSIDNVDEYVFENLREFVTTTLKSQMLYNERKEAEEKLSIVVNELKKYNRELSDLSVNDVLTGLYNRRGFYIYGEDFYKSAIKTKESFIVFFGDIDGLKKINDTFGHKEGDEAIKAVANILKTSFRSYDIIARIGGDEFIIMAANIYSESDIATIMKRINCNFEAYYLTNQKPYRVSIIIGHSIYHPSSSMTFEELINHADKELYKKKNKTKFDNPL
jgi:diguanylate cyclase (GGDEF)-like protein